MAFSPPGWTPGYLISRREIFRSPRAKRHVSPFAPSWRYAFEVGLYCPPLRAAIPRPQTNESPHIQFNEPPSTILPREPFRLPW